MAFVTPREALTALGCPLFQTSDGYLFGLLDGEWTDGDMSFRDRHGVPVDEYGEPLDGALV